MKRLVLPALLSGLLALLPVAWLWHIWPTVPAQVPWHYGLHGEPGNFADRQSLWGVACWPGIAWVVLTFFPQVHEGQSLFWSSARQRRVRLGVVSFLAVVLLALMHRGVRAGRPAELRQRAQHHAAVAGALGRAGVVGYGVGTPQTHWT